MNFAGSGAGMSGNGKYKPHFKYLYLTSYSCCSKACCVAFGIAKTFVCMFALSKTNA
jgi:hypothetical protein